jgi:hypothetical protein
MIIFAKTREINAPACHSADDHPCAPRWPSMQKPRETDAEGVTVPMAIYGEIAIYGASLSGSPSCPIALSASPAPR